MKAPSFFKNLVGTQLNFLSRRTFPRLREGYVIRSHALSQSLQLRKQQVERLAVLVITNSG